MRPVHRAFLGTAIFLVLVQCIRTFWNSDLSEYYSAHEGIAQPLKAQADSSTSTQVETSIPGSAVIPGFALLDRLYLRNGTFFIVTANQSAFPPRWSLIAPARDVGAGHDVHPTDKELQFIDPGEAEKMLGQKAIRIEGFSVVVYDTKQFMPHFYHWWGEIILGFWRVYSALFVSTSPTPPFPARFILPFVNDMEWRDPAGVTAPTMHASFPSSTIETKEYWEDLEKLGRTVVLDRAMIVSRETSTRHPLAGQFFKMIASTMSISPAPDFFEPIRRTVVTNLLGYLPIINAHDAVASSPTSDDDDDLEIPDIPSDLPIVTYVSRQGGKRRLSEKDREGLLRALNELEKEGVCKVIVARMERMNVREQVAVAARSTILLGVHGNGMTHQIWMPPSSRSTVIEIFALNGFLFDYEMLARNMGHKHYMVWNDTLMTYPKGTYHDRVYFPEDFQGVSIPVHGPSVARVIRQRLTGDLP